MLSQVQLTGCGAAEAEHQGKRTYVSEPGKEVELNTIDTVFLHTRS